MIYQRIRFVNAVNGRLIVDVSILVNSNAEAFIAMAL